MTLADLVATSAAVARTSRRLEKIERLASLLSRLERQEVATAVAFLTGGARQGRIGVGGALLSTLRDVPPASSPSLTLAEVDEAFGALSRLQGTGVNRARRDALVALLSQATAAEQDFLARVLFGELRQGALQAVLLDAVARAAGLPAAAVRRATMLAGDAGEVAVAALLEGEAALLRFQLQLFRPIQPMLADAAADISDAMTRLGGDASLEFKLDGARIQVHKSADNVRVYSRALREVTPVVPEVVERLRQARAQRLILDGEVIALRTDGTPHPFQVTMRRFGRRLDVEALRRELPLSPFFFDLLLVDGESLLDRPQWERFSRLRELVPAELIVSHVQARDVTEATAFAARAAAAGHEGVMAKSPRAAYAAGSRGSAWLKVKTPHALDLVVLAAEWGSGRRTGWLSNLHLGARDEETGELVMLGKTFKGLTDGMLAWQTARLLSLERRRERHVVHVRPELVVEIAFNEIQTSPRYPGGIALRFARVRRYREDKSASEIDTVQRIRALGGHTS